MKSDFEKFVEETIEMRRRFWEEEYPAMNLEKKKKYWLANTHHGMRSHGDQSGDPYNEFTKEWHEDVKKREPQFDEIFKAIVPGLGYRFDWKEYHKRIQR
jgi:hypothetical protein